MIFKYLLKWFLRNNKKPKTIKMFCTSDNKMPECVKLEMKNYKAMGYIISLSPTLSIEQLNILNARYSYMNNQLKLLNNIIHE